MDSNLDHGDQHYHNQPPQQQQQMNSGLTRYKSAPSSYFATLLNTVNFGGEDFDEVLNPLRVSSPETDRIFQRFVSSGGSADQISSAQNPLQQSLCQMRGNEPAQHQFLGSMKHEQEDFHSQSHHQQHQQQQMLYQGQCQEGHNSVVVSTSAMDNSFLATNSVAMDRLPPMRMSRDGGGGNSNLIRQSSSPAGFFSQINIENGFPVMRGMGNYGTSSGGTRAESSFPTAKRLKNQMNFSSGPTSSSGLLARIPEIAGKSMGASNLEDATFDETQPKDENYMDGFASGSWDDSSILSENFLKGLGESDRSSTYHDMDLSENQSNEGRSRPPTTLTHHLSLPTSSTELSAMFQDSVPLRIRAKRGCATHPRSIAERVRRTKISERMRKLQELVPNMDKQTNTSDMLDLAVDYIKDLQKQVKTLADQHAKCTCSSQQKP